MLEENTDKIKWIENYYVYLRGSFSVFCVCFDGVIAYDHDLFLKYINFMYENSNMNYEIF